MVTWLAIFYFLIVQTIFNEFAPPQSVGWSIFYYCSLWGSFIAISVDHWIKDNTVIRKQTFLISTIPMLFQFFLHLYCINKTYIEWYRITDSRLFEIIFLFLIIISFILIVYKNRKQWVINLKKIGW